MNIQRYLKKYAKLKKREGINMEMVKETTMYTTAKKVDVLQAIKKCTKKYEKALTNLAK
ncbi:hypothetical protein [Clostridium neonatale]|uniref:Uncharacterized protein n=2 Tax=Clostridium neonatale TaxID=137838 RepID=A0AAD1YJM7_9CLOT|nr:hypothetical protein [Clostridium neonatale]MBP8311336.1 hypothetical protein [Clostridium neonatale]CAI3192639.1 hypothetical protein CNEO2_1080014 [Clostridium neonatale]CAI3211706.1 hypothetical protein CNEO2_700032 [Clostridium neonatale]CAI3214208.1 hypothetical protein CNEO2_710008 [Clostridium neonatale]CAI3240021.1 hypothetical protein CNEO2_340055 [Clostridium neonatale]